MNEVVEKWLSSGELKPCYFRSMGNNYALLRVEKNRDFEYLFCQWLYSKRSIEWKESRGGTVRWVCTEICERADRRNLSRGGYAEWYGLGICRRTNEGYLHGSSSSEWKGVAVCRGADRGAVSCSGEK